MSARTPFYPILMHFAARYSGYTYGEFASDYKALVDSNLRCREAFGMDAVGLISDPYRETSAFGAKVTFPDEQVPRCMETIVGSIEDIALLKNPDVYKMERTMDRIKAGEALRKQVEPDVPVIGWVEGPLAESCDLAGVNEVLLKIFMERSLSIKLCLPPKILPKPRWRPGVILSVWVMPSVRRWMWRATENL